MTWNILNDGLAYKKQKELLTITTQVGRDQEGKLIADAPFDGYFNSDFMVIDNESLYMKDWMDLRQFNNSCDLIHQIRGINEILGNDPLPSNAAVLDSSLIKVSNVRENEGYYDLCFDITYKEETFSCEVQFIKYTYISANIVENKVWNIKDLHSFAVNFQKVLFDMGMKYDKDSKPLFLQVDSDIEKLLKQGK